MLISQINRQAKSICTYFGAQIGTGCTPIIIFWQNTSGKLISDVKLLGSIKIILLRGYSNKSTYIGQVPAIHVFNLGWQKIPLNIQTLKPLFSLFIVVSQIWFVLFKELVVKLIPIYDRCRRVVLAIVLSTENYEWTTDSHSPSPLYTSIKSGRKPTFNN